MFQILNQMSKPYYTLQEIWRMTPTVKRQEIQEKLDISRGTLWRWINDPAAIRLDQAIKLCDYMAIENPRDLVTPLNS